MSSQPLLLFWDYWNPLHIVGIAKTVVVTLSRARHLETELAIEAEGGSVAALDFQKGALHPGVNEGGSQKTLPDSLAAVFGGRRHANHIEISGH